MDNRVGDKVPEPKQIDKWMAEIDRLAKEIDGYTVHLDTETRKHLLRFRPGGEKVATMTAELAQSKKIELPGSSPEDMAADLTLAARLRPLQSALRTLADRLDDTVFEAESEAWWAVTGYYTALRGLARSDGALQSALAPIEAFFATGRRKPRTPAAK